MIDHLRLVDLDEGLIDQAAGAFASWPKTRDSFVDKVQRIRAGEIEVIVALIESEVVGYTGVHWTATYPPFAAAGIPEINDFNVIAAHRRQGIGSALMDEAERRICLRSDIAGIGVGLYRDYGSAQRMYVKRGYIPDGRGITYGDDPVIPGASIRIDDDAALWFTKALSSRSVSGAVPASDDQIDVS